MSAPQEVQAAVASNIPMGRWAPKTLDKMRGEGWQIDPSKTMGENAAQNNQPMQQAQRAVTNTGAAFGATVNAAGQGLAGGLGNAKQLLADRGSQMWNFMAQNGYANHGEAWCGEFTGAVVHSQGVQPPKGAAVASNWLNWGTHVDPGDVRPGDIAVQKYSRYGGAAEAGKPGSHVGIVQDTGNGSFNLLAGNQGAPVTARNTRDFEFRRPPAGQGGGGGQSAQQQPQQGGGGGQSAQQGASAEDKALTITNPFTQGVDALGKLGQQANQGFSDNRSWLIPLLSGIGKMASSNSPYFGTALLQGLGGGAEAWAHEQQAQAGLGETQARTGEIRSRSGEIDARTQHQLIENSHGVLFTAPGSNMPMIHYVDSQGRIGVMDYGSYQQRAGSEKLRWATPDEVARYSKGGMQPAQPSPVVNPTAYPAGGGGGSSLPVFTMPPGVSGAPPVIGAPAPKVPLAPPPAPLPQAPSTQPAFGVGMSDASKADAASERPFVYGDPNSTQRKVGADWYQDAQERSRAAEDNRFITRELAKNTGAMLNHTGVAVTGALGNERAGVLQKVQTVLKGLGWTTDLPTSADSDAEINRKLTTFFGAQQAQGAGQHSHQAMTQIMSALPGMHLTPETNAAIVSQILGIQQRDRDMGVYANQWNGGAPNSATHHLAASGFRRDSPDYMNETNYLNWLLLKKPAQFQQLMDHEGISQADFEKRMQSLPVPKGMPKPPPNISRYFY
jgi:hypothetical protein